MRGRPAVPRRRPARSHPSTVLGRWPIRFPIFLTRHEIFRITAAAPHSCNQMPALCYARQHDVQLVDCALKLSSRVRHTISLLSGMARRLRRFWAAPPYRNSRCRLICRGSATEGPLLVAAPTSPQRVAPINGLCGCQSINFSLFRAVHAPVAGGLVSVRRRSVDHNASAVEMRICRSCPGERSMYSRRARWEHAAAAPLSPVAYPGALSAGRSNRNPPTPARWSSRSTSALAARPSGKLF